MRFINFVTVETFFLFIVFSNLNIVFFPNIFSIFSNATKYFSYKYCLPRDVIYHSDFQVLRKTIKMKAIVVLAVICAAIASAQVCVSNNINYKKHIKQI